MDLAALSDPEDSEELRARLRASADRDASALLSGADIDAPAAEPSAADVPPPPEPLPPPVFVEAVYDDQPAPVTVRLRHPFRVGELRVSEVHVAEPRFEHVEALLEGRITRKDLYALMTNLPVEILGALRWTDAERVFAACSNLAPE